MGGTRVAVYGASGHGRVVADVAVSAGREVAGFVDDTRTGPVGAWTVLGDGAWLQTNGELEVALGIGDNAARERVSLACVAAGIALATLVHGGAIISPSATLGRGVVVMPGAVINAGAIVGDGAIINTGAVVEHDVVVGRFAHVSPNAALGGAARLGDHAHLGLGAVVLPMVSVGAGAVIGAGAVVARDLGPRVVAVGVPARPRRKL